MPRIVHHHTFTFPPYLPDLWHLRDRGWSADEDLRAELAHDLDVYDAVMHPLSKQAMAHRIDELVRELDVRAAAQKSG